MNQSFKRGNASHKTPKLGSTSSINQPTTFDWAHVLHILHIYYIHMYYIYIYVHVHCMCMMYRIVHLFILEGNASHKNPKQRSTSSINQPMTTATVTGQSAVHSIIIHWFFYDWRQTFMIDDKLLWLPTNFYDCRQTFMIDDKPRGIILIPTFDWAEHVSSVKKNMWLRSQSLKLC